ncbi:stage IV sporulation protein A [Oxobacter pfennigii]|uniref:Stage IV sporulation protein A n=1 Tax=Oxobacter pfennigii TaxID=36849 RepID=A0A0P9AF61_9CLOT|nr:stage IV sporulation protein A [Oxobacter pfennigii]KPU44001.1 stage IV sporulation protein A [Oxobacter pfennigii]
MEEFDLYKDIAVRTQGDIYVGVVGPVRTGKSTFIKRFMDLLVIPNIDNNYKKERAKDELPQSAAGRTIMTTEPKFVPNEAVEIKIKDNAKLKIRMVDCVGYLVKDALGYLEGSAPRMVTTPWFDYQIPFEQAAELGTRKVINDHSTIGIVVTTDGSITDIPRENYLDAEERVIKELKYLNKPFVMILNSMHPDNPDTITLKKSLEEKYDIPVQAVDVMQMRVEDIDNLLENVLFEFPIKEINIDLPDWVDVLEMDHWLKRDFLDSVKFAAKDLYKLRDIKPVIEKFNEYDFIGDVEIQDLKPGEGIADVNIRTKDGLFYQVLGEFCGYKIDGERHLLGLMKDLSIAKHEYDRIADALKDVRETGYGLVPPQMDELKLEEPEIVKQGGKFGVKLRASAPSLHMIRADIETEVSPVVGTEKQGEDLVKSLLEQFESDPAKLWQSNMFGKTLEELVKEGLQSKLFKMPEDVQSKLQRTVQKIVNEGGGGLICIIL